MIKPTKFHLTTFHIYYFVIGKVQTYFLTNNQNNACTKLSNKIENIFGRKEQNGPITSTFELIKLD